MATELILMSDVEGLGPAGTIVTVADGYARNHLIPRKLASPVTRAATIQLETKRRQREALLEEDLRAARALAASIEQASCTIPVKAGQDEKLFGSVTAGDIAEALSKQNIEVDKRKIQLEDPIRELGIFSVKINPHPEVEASLKVWVVEE